MRDQLELFFTALGFFTRLPVPAWVPWSSERMHHAARYFALVGWVVGGAGALGYLALAWLLPPAVAVVLSMALTIRLTGAFHEDGFADSCDGLGGGWDKAQILAIMKDSRIGSYGTIGMVLMLLAKAAALVELASPAVQGAGVALALLVAHPLSRLAATVVLHRLLRSRLGEAYDPAEQLGGALYLFLRGMCGEQTPVFDGSPAGVFSWHPPAELIIAVSDLLDGPGGPA